MDESLLEKSVKRVQKFGPPRVITVAALKTLTARVLQNLSLNPTETILEPAARNTAPAIALLCKLFELEGRADQIIGVFPADHLISDESAFNAAIELAKTCAEENQIVTLGIKPEYPATGFGYIEISGNNFRTKDSLAACSVQGFREKPNLETARNFLAKKNFYWNAGIFVFKVETMILRLSQLCPEIWKGLNSLKLDLSNLQELYSTLPKVSIDYAVMEKLRDGLLCIPCDIGWSDLGSWDDVSKFSSPPFSIKFANKSDVVKANAENNFVFSMTDKVYGLIDVKNLIIVDTPDALLVTQKGSTQDVKLVVDQLTSRGHRAAKEHGFERRPWGTYLVLKEEVNFKSKLIVIDPGAQISYQLHHKRNEHWIITEGEAEVTLDGTTKKYLPGEALYVPAGVKHRIRNFGSTPLQFVEVQTGTYFGEDDIERFDDDYGRV